MYNESTTLSEIDTKTLGLIDWLKIVWSFFWRGLLIMLSTGLIGFIFGFMLSFIAVIICRLIHFPFTNIKMPLMIFSVIIGICIGFVGTIIQIKWILKIKYRDYKFALIRHETSDPNIIKNTN